MTQEEINSTVVDVVYDEAQIYHVLKPNLKGIRGIPASQFMIRDKIENAKIHLSHLDQVKIMEYENKLKEIN